jgi:hypothetical protein
VTDERTLVGIPSLRRLRRRRDHQDIDALHARWRLLFYCWRWLLYLIPATVQAVEVIVALIEGRPPHLLVPLPRL